MDKSEQIKLAAEIVAAYVSHNSVPADALPALIGSVNAALQSLGQPEPVIVEPQRYEPFVPVKKSVTDEYLVSLFDGRKLKSLKRHLLAAHGMTPADYRAAFGLPASYPMVAANYAAKRSQLAKTMGLGRRAETASVIQ